MEKFDHKTTVLNPLRDKMQEICPITYHRCGMHLQWSGLTNLFRGTNFATVQEYFGSEVALYFMWIQFYNKKVFGVALVGLFITLYAYYQMYHKEDFTNTSAALHCDEKIYNQISQKYPPVCPNMYKNITETKELDAMFLNFNDPELCEEAKKSYIFDNPYSIWYVLLMTIWVSVFSDLWQRHENLLQTIWGVDSSESDPSDHFTRGPYRIAAAGQFGKPVMNPNTLQTEKVVKSRHILKSKLLSLVIELGTIIGFLCFTSCLILFSQYTKQASQQAKQEDGGKKIGLKILTMFIKITLIQIVNGIHKKVIAPKLVDLEHHKTQAAYDQSLADKEFKFQWINYNFPIIYLAFIRPLSDTSPDSLRKLSSIGYGIPLIGGLISKIFENVESFLTLIGLDMGDSKCGMHMTSMCRGGSCIIELAFYLISLLTYNALIIGNLKEWIIPRIKDYFGKQKRIKIIPEDKEKSLLPFEKDFLKTDFLSRDLFFEYGKLVTNHGFATQFLAVMPLGPFFIWVLNAVEKRLDADKYLSAKKRTTPRRNASNTYWQKILFNISVFAVFSNGVLLTITTDQIPRYVYTVMNLPDSYLDHPWPIEGINKTNEKGLEKINEHRWLNYFESTMTKIDLACITRFDEEFAQFRRYDHSPIPSKQNAEVFLYSKMFQRYHHIVGQNYSVCKREETIFNKYVPMFLADAMPSNDYDLTYGSIFDPFFRSGNSEMIDNETSTDYDIDSYNYNYHDFDWKFDSKNRDADDSDSNADNYDYEFDLDDLRNKSRTCQQNYDRYQYNHGQAYTNKDIGFEGIKEHNFTCTWFTRKEKTYKDSDLDDGMVCCEMEQSKQYFQLTTVRLLFMLFIITFAFILKLLVERIIPDQIGGLVKRKKIESALSEIIGEFTEDYNELLNKGSKKLENIRMECSRNLTDEEIEEKYKSTYQYMEIQRFETALLKKHESAVVKNNSIYQRLKNKIDKR